MPRSTKDRIEDVLPDRLPIDVLPKSNEEFVPPAPTRAQRAITAIAMEECDRQARRHGLSRRRFLQTGAAYAICLAAINQVMGTRGGRYALAYENGTCEPPLRNPQGTVFPIEFPGAQLANLPGEFIMDLQTHHVDSGGAWRARNPGQAAFFGVVWPQGACGETDRIECLGRFHYLKELFLDSSTNVCILSAVPFREDGQPLPTAEAAKTCELVESLSGTRRAYMHKFVMPNRGSLGTKSDGALGKGSMPIDPLFWPEERDAMTAAAETWGGKSARPYLRAWKVYTPWGDVPYTTGWWLDDPVGINFIAHALELSHQYDIPALICAHKGFALTAFDQEKAATRDVGVVAKMFPAMNFMIYHSGFDNSDLLAFPPGGLGTSTNGPYPLDTFEGGLGSGSDEAVLSTRRGVDNFIKALRENGWSARNFAPGGKPGVRGHTSAADLAVAGTGDGDPEAHADVPNVYAELGSVWSSVADDPERASHLLGKLIYYVGAKRIVWGTDCLWYGSPQSQIVPFRTFQMSDEVKELYRLPYGLEGDVDEPTQPAPSAGRTIRNGILGRNAAAVYRIDPDAALGLVRCDDVQKIRDQYQLNPLASHEIHGPRTRRELFARLRKDPWHRGALGALNERGFGKRPV